MRNLDKLLSSISRKIEFKFKKLTKSNLYKGICSISTVVTLVGSICNITFLNEFHKRTLLYIIFLFAIAWVLLSKILKVKFEEVGKLDVGLWSFIFITHVIGFVYR